MMGYIIAATVIVLWFAFNIWLNFIVIPSMDASTSFILIAIGIAIFLVTIFLKGQDR